jgi:transmembrane sensor
VPDDGLTEEAALWFTRMRGPDAETDRLAFEAWLAESRAHREAYNWIGEVYSLGRLIDPEPDAAIAVHPQRRRRLQAVLAAALVLFLSAAGWALLDHQPSDFVPVASWQSSMTARSHVKTEVGQIRTVRLPDGSRVTLDTNSAVAFTYQRDIRRLVVVRGRARFEVAHEARPFVVDAGKGTITAHGTIFDVGMTPDGAVEVRLLRGSVYVALPARGLTGSHAVATTRQLMPGQQVLFGTSGLPPARTVATPDERWPEGMLECDGMALADLLARANRYARPQLVLADARLGALKVSGTFRIDIPQVLADRLAAVFGLHVQAQGASRIVIDRGPLSEINSKSPL